jgi:hypothetical protein
MFKGSVSDWVLCPAQASITYQVGPLFIKMLLICAAHKELPKCPTWPACRNFVCDFKNLRLVVFTSVVLHVPPPMKPTDMIIIGGSDVKHL